MVVVVVDLLVTTAAGAAVAHQGRRGTDVPYRKLTSTSRISRLVRFGKWRQHADRRRQGCRDTAADKTTGERLFTIETSLRVRAGAGAKITSVRCQLRLPKGVP